MRRTNYFSDPALARASDNLAQIVAGNPEGDAAFRSALSRAKLNEQEGRFARENRGFVGSAATAFGDGNKLKGFQDILRTGDASLINTLGNYSRAYGGAELADGLIDTDQMRALMAGAGGAGLDANTALTFDEGNQISARDANESRAQATEVANIGADSAFDIAEMKNINSVDGQLGRSLAGSGMGTEEMFRVNDPLSSDETLASALAGDPNQLGYVRFGNGPNADAAESALGGAEPYDPLDATRLRTLQDQIESATTNQLVDMNAPTTETADGNQFDYSQAPDLVPSVVKYANDLQALDLKSGRPPQPASHYVTKALRALNVQVNENEGWFNSGTNISYTPASGPAPGTIEDGFQFIGGDPSDSSNWQPVGR